MTAFVVVVCLVALSLGFAAGVIVGLVVARRDAERVRAYCGGEPHVFWQHCADCERTQKQHQDTQRGNEAVP